MATAPPHDDAALTEGWPPEPGNDELARFAASLRASRPQVSSQAIARVADAMFREMERDHRPAPSAASAPVWRLARSRVALAAAASAMLAGGIWLAVARPGGGPRQSNPAASSSGWAGGAARGQEQPDGAQSQPTPAEPADVHLVND